MNILSISIFLLIPMCFSAVAASLRSLHCVMAVTERRQSVTQRNEMELWMMDDRVRAESNVQGQKGIEIKTGGYKYVFMPGRTDGIKIPADSAAWGQLDWLRELDSFKRAATKLAVVTVEGITCDKYQRVGGNISTTVWISQTNGFPVKAVWRVSRESVDTVSTMTFKNVEVKTIR